MFFSHKCKFLDLFKSFIGRRIMFFDLKNNFKIIGIIHSCCPKTINIDHIRPEYLTYKIIKNKTFKFNICKYNLLYSFKSNLVNKHNNNIYYFKMPEKITKINRRANKRNNIPMKIQVAFYTNYGSYQGIIEDISYGGIGIYLPSTKLKNLSDKKIKVDYNFEIFNKKVFGKGVLVHHSNNLAICFKNLDYISIINLNNIILQIRKKQNYIVYKKVLI